ncbi:hypothetical protein [Anaeromyxobacter terrae]|uniref:hypothetical protein n=1 Tax=Anaeromyxobacter terrae TaxID=2925406 RepID=UPI001F58B1E8|nr:hypothetical protein [Anaeromyxobacter sp. SG22]
MATKANGKVQLVQVSADEALGAQIAATMLRMAIEALRCGGYAPAPEQLAQLSREVTRTALAMGKIIADDVHGGSPFPDDVEIDDAAELGTHALIREVLGPAPMAH